MYKGVALHTVGKIVFILSNFLIHYYLGNTLSAEVYGVVGTIITVINFGNLFFTNGVRQAISNAIAQKKFNIRNIIKKGMGYQCIIIIIITAVSYFCAPLIASVFNDMTLVPYIRISAFILPPTGIYFASLGIFNGFKLFVIEAALATIYPLLKLLVIPFVSMHLGGNAVTGMENGFLVSISVTCVIAVIILIRKRKRFVGGQENIPTKEFVKSSINYIILFCIVPIIMNMDTVMVKALTTDGAMVGYYTGAVTFAKAPYFLLSPFFLVILPVITSFYTQKDMTRAKNTISDFLTVILAIILPIVTIVSATSDNLLSVFYTPDYAEGGTALSFLIFGTMFLGMVVVFNNIISATGKKKFTVLHSIFMLAAFLIVCFFLTKTFSITGAGLGTFIVCLVALIASMAYTAQLFGNYFSKKHGIILVINVCIFIVLKALFGNSPINHFFILLLIYLGIYLIHFGILRLFRIISINQIKTALRGKKKSEN